MTPAEELFYKQGHPEGSSEPARLPPSELKKPAPPTLAELLYREQGKAKHKHIEPKPEPVPEPITPKPEEKPVNPVPAHDEPLKPKK